MPREPEPKHQRPRGRRAPAELVTATPTEAPPRSASRARLPPKRRVLIADDNVDAADAMGMYLEALGAEVRTAYDGEGAIQIAREFKPDLVLLDIGMPTLDGYEVARRMRREPWSRAITLVALTGWGREEDRVRSREAGFDGHLVKPVNEAALEQLVCGSVVSVERLERAR